MRRDVVGADAENLGTAVAKNVVGVTELAGLGGATRRIVLGIEVEDDRPAAEVGQLDGLAGVTFQLELRGGLAFFDHA